jgi:hypothetical protein
MLVSGDASSTLVICLPVAKVAARIASGRVFGFDVVLEDRGMGVAFVRTRVCCPIATAGRQLARNAVATGSAAALMAGNKPPIRAIAIAQHRLTTTRCAVTAM